MRTNVCVSFLVAYAFAVTCIEGARILAVFPTPSISHQVVFRPLTQELARRGHEVIVITTDPAFPKGQTPANLTEIDVHDLSYSAWKRFVEASDGSTDNWLRKIEIALDLLTKIFVKQMNTKEAKDLIFGRNLKFDLLLAEACVRPTLGLSDLLNVPTIVVSSFGSILKNFEVLGAPSHPFFYPSPIRDRLYNLTFWEKITQLYKEIKFSMLLQSFEARDSAVVKELFGSDTPTISELYNNIEMLFVNVHPIWEDNRPVPPNVIFMGGLHQQKPKKLPQEIQTYLDSSKNGVIYISFGTNVQPSLLPRQKIQTMVNVLSQLPYDVLWKWDKDDLPGRSKNIKISKWLPQSDLLRHPRVQLFITQGGLQSTDEAITAGVPLIGMPMLVDQWYNVEKYVYHKIGLRLDINNLNEDKLREALNTILTDTSYRQNVVRLREIIRDQPQRPLERAVWWAEHVLRHRGARHLRPPTANMNWTDFCEIELLCFTVVLVLLALLVLYVLVSNVYKLGIKTRILKNIKLKVL